MSDELKGVDLAVSKEEKKEEEKIDNKGKLFLRHFDSNPEISPDKIFTKLRGKVYFPNDPNIEPGWYIASVLSEQDQYGIMDTMKMKNIPVSMWRPDVIHGIYIKKNFKKKVMEVHRAIPKTKLAEGVESPVIFEVAFDPQDELSKKKIDKSNTIEAIINAKKETKAAKRK